MMRVAILGTGGIGLCAAAVLCEAGHSVVLWSPTGKPPPSPLVSTGAVIGTFTPDVATDCAQALAGATAVLIAVPGYGHRAVIEAMAPHLQPGQVVLYSSHMSFGALYLQSLLRARGVECPIVAWGTTVVTGRRIGPAAAHVGNIRSRLDAAVLGDPAGLEICRALFGDRFVARDGLLPIALSNLNPQNHLGIALCNLTRMEKGEAWKQNANITPAVARLMLALDAERLAIAAAFGITVRTLEQHFHLSFNIAQTDMATMAAELATRDSDPFGPATLQTRYVLEDMPFGIAPMLQLAAAAGVPAPLHAGGLAVMSALYGRDLAADNDLLPLVETLVAELLAG
jgi:opine dehydrogenase